MSDETITDEEFERLLDELHGPAGGAETAPQAGASGDGREEVVALAADLRIGSAQALAERLRSCLEGVGTVVIEGGAVEQVDTAGLQLLAAFTRQLRDQESRLTWREASPALRDGAALLGLLEVLGLEGADGQGSGDARCGDPR